MTKATAPCSPVYSAAFRARLDSKPAPRDHLLSVMI